MRHLFLGQEAPPCPDAADIDDSGEIEITHAIALLQHLFLGGAPPAPPWPDAGPDPTQDALPRC